MARRVLPLVIILPLIHLLLRIWFWCANRTLFPDVFSHQAGPIFLRGLQQDWVSLLIVNLPTIFLLLCRSWIKDTSIRWGFAIAARVFFVAGNVLAFALNCIDIGYFRFDRHRASLDLDLILGDSLSSFKSMLLGYWPILLAFAGLVIITVKLAALLPGKLPGRQPQQSPLILGLGQMGLLVIIFFSAGFPGRPVIPATPLLSISPVALPLAQNSLMTWAYSVAHVSHELKPVNYFSRAELDSIVQSSHRLSSSVAGGRFQKKNVVVFIVESFSRCYVTPGNPMKANTPFLDSLIGRSLYFPNSFSNAVSSNQGIVSILGGLPALMDEPFYYSEYANTPLKSLGNILRDSGYSTNFLMGANRDHFGFGKFAKMAGIDNTYWKSDFNDDRYYDGNWGIFDEPFLEYGGHVLGVTPQPFLGVFFTITMHAPYTIPESYRRVFDYPDKTPAQRVVSYTDHAFRQFFSVCRHMPWYRNTLFVFCADHWMDPSGGHMPFSAQAEYTIPMFIYDPANDKGRRCTTVAGQVDLAPTVLDLLGYRGTYTGFGRSLLDTTVGAKDRYVINRSGADYQIITDEYVYGYDPERDQGSYLYRYVSDSACRHDLLKDGGAGPVGGRLERLLKANIQRYRESLTARNLFSF